MNEELIDAVQHARHDAAEAADVLAARGAEVASEIIAAIRAAPPLEARRLTDVIDEMTDSAIVPRNLST